MFLPTFTVDFDSARVRQLHAAQYPQQSRFAGSIFAKQGVNLASLGGKINLVEGPLASEPLGYPDHADRVEQF